MYFLQELVETKTAENRMNIGLAFVWWPETHLQATVCEQVHHSN